MIYESTKVIELGSCAFRQWKATHSHCQFIHGYRLIAKFYFGCSSLDEKNWVVDFGGVKGLKDILEKQFDHTLCVAWDDPHMSEFRALHEKRVVDLRVMDHGVGIERTAEWCLIQADNFIRKETNNRCWVTKVEVWEHDKNSSIVTANNNNTVQITPQVATNHITTGNSETIATTIQPNINPTSTVVNAGINVDRPAPLNTQKSKGYSNLFGGTSWGM